MNINGRSNVLVTGLHIGDSGFGGVVNFNRLLIKYLTKSNYSVDFFSIGKSPSWYNGSEKVTKRSYYTKFPGRLIKFIFVLRKQKIEVVIVNSSLTLISLVRDGIFSLVARLFGSKTIFLFHGWKDKEYDKVQNNKIINSLFRFLCARQNAIGTSSEHHLDSLKKIGVNGQITFTFSTMVETELYKPSKEIQKDIDVLFAANPLCKNKGVNEFIAAVKILIDNSPEMSVVLIGGGDELEKYKEISSSNGLDNNLNFMGYVDHKKKVELFQKSKIFVLPSYTEGFPNVVLEAMAAHSALIVTPVGGLAEAISDKVNGLVINSMPPDPEEIAQHINTLIKNKELISSIIQNNQTELMNKYDTTIVSNIFKEAISSLESC